VCSNVWEETSCSTKWSLRLTNHTQINHLTSSFPPSPSPTAPVNDPPVPTPKTYNTNEDTSLYVAAGTGLLQGATDVDGGTLTVISVTSPTTQGGTVTLDGTGGAFVHGPSLNFNGQDTFTYTISDGNGGTASSQVTMNVGRLLVLGFGTIDRATRSCLLT